ncbi:MAG: hypothetical protein IZT56_11505 [Bacteroidetes bacterium]|nr:hypothetical protein [Bacteroidota bacterium]
MKKRLRLTDSEAENLGLEISEKRDQKNAKYTITSEQLKQLYIYRGFDPALIGECIEKGISPEKIRHYWHKSEHFSLNVQEEKQDQTVKIGDVFDSIIEKHLKDFTPIKRTQPSSKSNKALKVTITDSHVGMNPNPGNNSLFQYEYNSKIYNKSIQKVYNSILKEYSTFGTFDLLLLDDLGDLADGWNGYTTRGGHNLPQNMTNAEVFEVCVDAYVNLIRSLVEANVANKIILRCICNDNHSGDFALIINKGIQKIINLMYSNDIVEVDILERFIEHRTYGDHCFVLTHGKDKEQMKGGLPVVLNDKAIRLINDYIEHYDINSKFIHVEKGDLHQIGYQRTKKFDYRNFMSFAPPSSWIQHNFGDSYSGYSIQVIPKFNNEISHTDYFIEYDKRK